MSDSAYRRLNFEKLSKAGKAASLKFTSEHQRNACIKYNESLTDEQKILRTKRIVDFQKENAKKVICFIFKDKDKIILNNYRSAFIASEETKISHSGIMKSCKNSTKSSGTFCINKEIFVIYKSSNIVPNLKQPTYYKVYWEYY